MGENKRIAIVFDLDGTLIDSAPDIHCAVNEMLLQNGKSELSLGKVTSFIGNGVPKLIERVMTEVKITVTDSLHKRFVAEFSGFYSQKPAEKSFTFQGVKTLLENLHGQGYKLAVCTNKPIGLTHQILNSLGISHFFEAAIGGDSLQVKKPDPIPLLETLKLLNVSKCIYVGDSEVDALTAINAKQPFFLFTEGYRKSPADEIPAEIRFNNFGNLFDLIQEYLTENTGI